MKTATKILSPERVQKLIKKRNEQFKAATKAEKRVLIAKDVIEQLRAKRIRAGVGKFFRSKTLERFDDNKICHRDTQFQDGDSMQQLLLENRIQDCECCAIGSMAVSCILFKNKVTVGDRRDDLEDIGDNLFYYESGTNVGLEKYFSMPQLKLIEIAFERGGGYNVVIGDLGEPAPDSRVRRALAFGKKYHSNDERLRAIMKNIIKNKGLFVP